MIETRYVKSNQLEGYTTYVSDITKMVGMWHLCLICRRYVRVGGLGGLKYEETNNRG
jgi:hypothetical protein